MHACSERCAPSALSESDTKSARTRIAIREFIACKWLSTTQMLPGTATIQTLERVMIAVASEAAASKTQGPAETWPKYPPCVRKMHRWTASGRQTGATIPTTGCRPVARIHQRLKACTQWQRLGGLTALKYVVEHNLTERFAIRRAHQTWLVRWVMAL